MRLRLPARQSARRRTGALASRAGLPRMADRAPRHADPRDHDTRLPDGRGAAVSAQPHRLPARRPHRPRPDLRFTFDGRATKATRATRSRRRCSRTACGSSPAASSTTVRAASIRPAPRSRTRWCGCAAATAPSPTPARRWSSSMTGSSPKARTAGRRSASTDGAQQHPVAAIPGRLLLQDVHVAGLAVDDL